MTTLDLKSQRTQFSMVISNIALCKNDIKEVLEGDLFSSYGIKYYAIIHDKDDTSFIHLHIILCFGDKKRVKQVVKYLSLAFDTPETNIQYRDIISFTSAIQYLIHKNENGKKFLYDVSEVMTNDSEENLNIYMTATEPIYVHLTTEKLLELVVQKELSDIDLILCIGKDNFKKYLSVINQLRKNVQKRFYGGLNY